MSTMSRPRSSHGTRTKIIRSGEGSSSICAVAALSDAFHTTPQQFFDTSGESFSVIPFSDPDQQQERLTDVPTGTSLRNADSPAEPLSNGAKVKRLPTEQEFADALTELCSFHLGGSGNNTANTGQTRAVRSRHGSEPTSFAHSWGKLSIQHAAPFLAMCIVCHGSISMVAKCTNALGSIAAAVSSSSGSHEHQRSTTRVSKHPKENATTKFGNASEFAGDSHTPSAFNVMRALGKHTIEFVRPSTAKSDAAIDQAGSPESTPGSQSHTGQSDESANKAASSSASAESSSQSKPEHCAQPTDPRRHRIVPPRWLGKNYSPGSSDKLSNLVIIRLVNLVASLAGNAVAFAPSDAMYCLSSLIPALTPEQLVIVVSAAPAIFARAGSAADSLAVRLDQQLAQHASLISSHDQAAITTPSESEEATETTPDREATTPSVGNNNDDDDALLGNLTFAMTVISRLCSSVVVPTLGATAAEDESAPDTTSSTTSTSTSTATAGGKVKGKSRGSRSRKRQKSTSVEQLSAVASMFLSKVLGHPRILITLCKIVHVAAKVCTGASASTGSVESEGAMPLLTTLAEPLSLALVIMSALCLHQRVGQAVLECRPMPPLLQLMRGQGRLSQAVAADVDRLVKQMIALQRQ